MDSYCYIGTGWLTLHIRVLGYRLAQWIVASLAFAWVQSGLVDSYMHCNKEVIIYDPQQGMAFVNSLWLKI